MFKDYIGKFVIVRSDKDGVWAGTLKALEGSTEGESRMTASLENCHLVHSWQSTAATAGLAVFGPGEGSNVSDATPAHICADVVGLSVATASSKKRFADIKKWNP